MSLSFVKFVIKTGQSAWVSATKTNKRILSTVAVVVTALGYFGVSLTDFFPEAAKTMWIGTALLIAIFIFFLFYNSYLVCSESETEKDKTVKEFDAFKKPRIEIVGEVEDKANALILGRIYRIRVKNVSGSTAKNCCLRLMSSNPKISDDPVTLLFSNSWAPQALAKIDLCPNDESLFIVCEKAGKEFVIRGEDRILQLTKDVYALNFCLLAEDTISTSFQVMIDPDAESVVSVSTKRST